MEEETIDGPVPPLYAPSPIGGTGRMYTGPGYTGPYNREKDYATKGKYQFHPLEFMSGIIIGVGIANIIVLLIHAL